MKPTNDQKNSFKFEVRQQVTSARTPAGSVERLYVLQQINIPMLSFVSNALLIVFLIVPIYSGVRLFLKQNISRRDWMSSVVISSVICYILILVAALLLDMTFENRLNKYDLDGDNFRAEVEITSDMEEAMSAVNHDTGRYLAPIIGLILSPIYCGFCHFLIGITSSIFFMRRNGTNKKETKPTD